MGELVSRIPELVRRIGMTDREFEARCYAVDLSLDTAKKLLQGETNVSTSTLIKVASILGVKDWGELMTFRNNGSS